jgi:hypothetical protein
MALLFAFGFARTSNVTAPSFETLSFRSCAGSVIQPEHGRLRTGPLDECREFHKGQPVPELVVGDGDAGR